ncbi:MAG: FAD-binding oxidoreductase [Alphaproteobacteria bacterium]|nr:FAD-binding oxidoreductase [Alphaproteobacteria bacterium]
MRPITEPDVLAGYLTDASNIAGRADGLFRPTTTEEVAEIVREANRTKTPLTVTAGRTSTTAAAVPMGGWLLSTERLNAIEQIGHSTATAQAGVFLGDFQDAIEATGRFYPPDPTSRRDCTLGASIATNASGARSFKYGPTRPWVESLEVVLANGEIVHADRNTPIPCHWPIPQWAEPEVKTAAGYVPTKRMLDVFIGQEGTLGILTRATVRLTDLPAEVLGFVVFFPTRQAALAFVDRARSAQRADPEGALSPRCLEYLDRHCLDLARERVGDVPDAAVAALFCEQEVSLDEETHLAAWWEALEACGALADDTLITTDDAGRENLHAFRHAIPAGINEQVVRNGMPKVGTDLSVPDAALSTIMEAYDHAPIRHVLFGHIGDNHLHLNLLPTTPDELARAKAFYDELAAQAVALGGSISAEHGIGKTKRDHLRTMVGDGVIEQFRRLKSHLDPNWILGRGNVIEPPL